MDWVWWSRALRNPRISSASRRSALPTNKGFAERSWREFGSAFFGRARGERQSNIAVAAAPSEVNGEDLNLHAFRHTPSNVCVCHYHPSAPASLIRNAGNKKGAWIGGRIANQN